MKSIESRLEKLETSILVQELTVGNEKERVQRRKCLEGLTRLTFPELTALQTLLDKATEVKSDGNVTGEQERNAHCGRKVFCDMDKLSAEERGHLQGLIEKMYSNARDKNEVEFF